MPREAGAVRERRLTGHGHASRDTPSSASCDAPSSISRDLLQSRWPSCLPAACLLRACCLPAACLLPACCLPAACLLPACCLLLPAAACCCLRRQAYIITPSEDIPLWHNRDIDRALCVCPAWRACPPRAPACVTPRPLGTHYPRVPAARRVPVSVCARLTHARATRHTTRHARATPHRPAPAGSRCQLPERPRGSRWGARGERGEGVWLRWLSPASGPHPRARCLMCTRMAPQCVRASAMHAAPALTLATPRTTHHAPHTCRPCDLAGQRQRRQQQGRRGQLPPAWAGSQRRQRRRQQARARAGGRGPA
jgi:hypothetical protein